MNNFTSQNKSINNTSDLIIYSNMLDYYLKHFSLLKKEIKVPCLIHYSRAISFVIFINDLTIKTGEKIGRIIKELAKNNLNFSIQPLPLCMFKNGVYPNNLQDHILNKDKFMPLDFLMGDGIKYVCYKEDKEFIKIGNLEVLSKCLSCKFNKDGKCNGIYVPGGSHICFNKIQTWLITKLDSLKNGEILDCGCGANPPFLDLYKKYSLKGRIFYLLDPSSNYLKTLKQMVSNHYNNIVLIKGTAEEMKFANSTFDMVVLRAAYSHLYNLNKALLDIKRVLKNGGILLIRDEKKKGVTFQFHSEKKIIPFDSHFRNHSLNQAIYYLTKYKFKILDSIEDEVGNGSIWVIKAQKTD